eukprot:12531770-Alexandrium_andersonii.AAC.1
MLTQVALEQCGAGAAIRLSGWNGYDISTRAGADRARAVLAEQRPQHLWIALPCIPWSRWQRLNQRTEGQVKNLDRQRQHSRKM